MLKIKLKHIKMEIVLPTFSALLEIMFLFLGFRWGVPSWLSRWHISLLISGPWVQAPPWGLSLPTKEKRKKRDYRWNYAYITFIFLKCSVCLLTVTKIKYKCKKMSVITSFNFKFNLRKITDLEITENIWHSPYASTP